jgi:hypothetical protein
LEKKPQPLLHWEEMLSEEFMSSEIEEIGLGRLLLAGYIHNIQYT